MAYTNPVADTSFQTLQKPQTIIAVDKSGNFVGDSAQSANISQINGAAPSATNPLYVHQAIGTPITSSATGAAAATAVATLSGVSNKTTYITGFTATSGNPGATVVGVVTVTGTISGTLSYQFTESATLGGELIVTFPTPIPASAVNTAIVVTIPAITSGAVVAIAAYGYQL